MSKQWLGSSLSMHNILRAENKLNKNNCIYLAFSQVELRICNFEGKIAKTVRINFQASIIDI